MTNATTKKRDVRESTILDAARRVLLEEGYSNFTMERIASYANCPKTTVYLHFSCKEDVIVALVLQSLQVMLDMMRRGAAFPGRSRERMIAVGEGAGQFSRLHRDHAQLLHQAPTSIREKASSHRVVALEGVERSIIDLLRGILLQAVADGELKLDRGISVEHMAFILWSLIGGGMILIQAGIPQTTLALSNPHHDLWRAFDLMADAYRWQPYSYESDWEEVFAEVRRTIFPAETSLVYGEGNWYGDAGTVHPRQTHWWPEFSEDRVDRT